MVRVWSTDLGGILWDVKLLAVEFEETVALLFEEAFERVPKRPDVDSQQEHGGEPTAGHCERSCLPRVTENVAYI